MVDVKFLAVLWVLILFSAIPMLVSGDDAEEEEKKLTKQIGNTVCEDEERSKNWYNCIVCCQSINPFKLKKDTECNAEARLGVYETKDMKAETRDRMCGGMVQYAEQLKKVVMDLKGDIKPCCGTKEGMQDLFDQKLKCFQNCFDGDDGIDKNKKAKYC
ncbi:hypothetical protein HDE_06873 [Halotydeus destructor]|nr:hypothetical protein HDE_06873 [Halotydeus destructor]